MVMLSGWQLARSYLISDLYVGVMGPSQFLYLQHQVAKPKIQG